jgi:tRNA threonylcarbamoyladenosine biosynthesis protein TsaE
MYEMNKNIKTFKINNVDEIIALGEKIGRLAIPNLVITMNGDLGAGKTTMTKGIAKGLGITKIVNSPTFTIMKIYEGRMMLYHLDVYRITNPDSDFELEEYFENDGLCVIEWADQIKKLLPDSYININITRISENERELEISLVGNNLKYQEIINCL